MSTFRHEVRQASSRGHRALTGVRIELFVAQNERRAAFWEFESATRSLDLNTISSGVVALLRRE